ncbi:MAG TPA: two-component system response regulator KdpE [Proteus sp.]|uniref:DNA-binding response regulator n=1 Tax=Proteus hauseri ATCC 700826 TaxID=1354271 RepID=A0AAJ3HS03_PROHU|nr:two-component system response regulator KdpE [Proteus hauseri]OAT46514.1 DNA-binding response regulator [Proteus hauseri ATCC 700826]QAV24679.1 two-component system response regulator KdpE [Proteus hauseri]HCH51353.1 two-component system response regulator KdpE [Proteus sp. (in: enterobacteria)]
MTPYNILIIEDEKEILRFVRLALENEDFRVYEASECQRGLMEAASRKPDLVILDLGLPDKDGIHFIQDFRQWSATPIIVLSARDSEQDKVKALDAGADDYLTKPFGISELLARVRASLRRTIKQENENTQFSFGDITIDWVNRTVTRKKEAIHLTPTEFRLLSELVNNSGKVLTQRHLMLHVWGPNFVEHSHYLRIYMGHLRQKLETDPTCPTHLITETGIGYRFMP